MLGYPVLHCVYTDFVASIIPPWIPWHLFWIYFTAMTIRRRRVHRLQKACAISREISASVRDCNCNCNGS
jgi:hypothetical protein